MIQTYKYSSGIVDNIDKIPFKDHSDTSKEYFRLFDIPEKFYAGKNSFRIRANPENLVKGSKIYIDVIDENGEPIYHELTKLSTSDGSKVIVVHIYADTPPGPIQISIAGRAKYHKNYGKIPYSNDQSSKQYKDIPNIVWVREFIAVPSKANRDEILFSEAPTIKYSERKAKYQKIPPDSNRNITVTGSAGETVELKTSTVEYDNSNTKFSNEGGSGVILDPTSDGGSLTTNTTSNRGEMVVMESTGFQFNQNMIGGKIVVNGIEPNYQANIISIIDKFTVEVDKSYNSGSGFTPQSNFTASYWTSDLSLATVASESFLELDIRNLEPAAGTVDSVKVSYKPYGTFGDFINVGDIPLDEKNLLVSREEYETNKTGLVEKEIGKLKDVSQYSTYWDGKVNSNIGLTINVEEPYTFESGFAISFSGSMNFDVDDQTFLGFFNLKDPYKIETHKNTEYKIQFSARFTETGSENVTNGKDPKQIDIYISGSDVQRNDVEVPLYKPLKDIDDPNLNWGSYIGSISTSEGKTLLKQKMYFKALESTEVTPVFVIRNGSGWEFKEIELTPRNENGFSPNTHKLEVPIQSLKLNNELVVKVEYLNELGINSGLTSELYGLYFSGSEGGVNEVIVSSSTDIDNLTEKQILFGNNTGSIGQSSLFEWDYDTDTMKVGDTEIGTGSIGFSTRRLIVKRGDNQDLIITGSTELKADGSNDILNVKTGSMNTFTINDQGVAIFGEFTTTPSPVTGGLMYSGSIFWVGL